MLSVQKLCCSYYEFLSKKYYPVIMLAMPSKNESITILKKKKVIKQAASK